MDAHQFTKNFTKNLRRKLGLDRDDNAVAICPSLLLVVDRKFFLMPMIWREDAGFCTWMTKTYFILGSSEKDATLFSQTSKYFYELTKKTRPELFNAKTEKEQMDKKLKLVTSYVL